MSEADGDPWVGHCRLILFFTGACYVFLGLALGALFAFTPVLAESGGDPPPPAFGWFMGAVMALFCSGFGAMNFVAAWGLGRGEKWGWVIGLILGAMYAPSICLPIGALLLYGLLNERTRRRFLS
jgi:hypothetical protein